MQQLNKIFTQVRATPFEDSCKAKKCSIVLWERSFPKALLNIVNFFFFFFAVVGVRKVSEQNWADEIKLTNVILSIKWYYSKKSKLSTDAVVAVAEFSGERYGLLTTVTAYRGLVTKFII